jgi:CTP:phosphocholine cytidylyltransferase-like protein
MTTAQLSQRIIADRTHSYGHYKVTIEYRGKKYSCTTTDSMAYDRYNDEDAKRGHYTQRDALKCLWNECKRKNNLY